MVKLDISDRERLSPAPAPTGAGAGTRSMRRGVAGSLALHLAAMLLILLGLPWLRQAPAPAERIVPINLVRLGPESAAPASAQPAPLPQQQAPEIATAETAEAVPVPQTPPPAAAPHATAARSGSELRSTAAPAPTSTVPPPADASAAPARSIAPLRRHLSPADALAARLDRLAQLRQPAAPLPPSPRRQDGAGLSSTTATTAHAARASDASYSVKDFIRAQVERRWTFDVAAPRSGAWVVAIHIMLKPDGSVSRAEVVETASYRSDSAYREFALSARNAVLLSSPLTVPPGDYAIAKDIVLDFSAKQVRQ